MGIFTQVPTFSKRPLAAFTSFGRDQAGSASVTGMMWSMIGLTLGGLAIDEANAWRIQTQLQVTADAAALAAATSFDDLTQAATLATTVAAMNMPVGSAGTVLNAQDVVFGTFDEVTDVFSPTTVEPNAVQVVTRRTEANGNALPTSLLRLVGKESWDVEVSSMAFAPAAEDAGGGTLACGGAAFVSSQFIQTGGSNNLQNGVCIHGDTGVNTGGGDYYENEIEMSADNVASVTINGFTSPDLTAADIAKAQDRSPQIAPMAASMIGQFWLVFKSSANHAYLNNAYICEDTSATDLGLAASQDWNLQNMKSMVPHFVKDASSCFTLSLKYGMWITTAAELAPYTVYVSTGAIRVSGSGTVENTLLYSNSYTLLAPGSNVAFDNFMAMSGNVQLAGATSWGNAADLCTDGYFRVYLLSRGAMALGTGGAAVPTNGVIAASPNFIPGGGMTGSGLYFESLTNTSLGGGMTIDGTCTEALTADVFTLPEWYSESSSVEEGVSKRTAYLRR